MFNGKRFVTSGIAEKVPLELQMIMWDMIDTMDEPRDYLQVFDLSEGNGKQKIVHSQEQPEYMPSSGSSPTIIFSIVDFPAPLIPTSAAFSYSSM